MKHFYAIIIGLLLGISSQAQTNNDLLGTWTSYKIREINVVKGDKSTQENNFEGERTYIFTSDTTCYVVTPLSDIQHPHRYKIIEDKIYFTLDPAYLEKLNRLKEEEHGIELEPTEWGFSIDPNKKYMYLILMIEHAGDSYETVITFKKQ